MSNVNMSDLYNAYTSLKGKSSLKCRLLIESEIKMNDFKKINIVLYNDEPDDNMSSFSMDVQFNLNFNIKKIYKDFQMTKLMDTEDSEEVSTKEEQNVLLMIETFNKEFWRKNFYFKNLREKLENILNGDFKYSLVTDAQQENSDLILDKIKSQIKKYNTNLSKKKDVKKLENLSIKKFGYQITIKWKSWTKDLTKKDVKSKLESFLKQFGKDFEKDVLFKNDYVSFEK